MKSELLHHVAAILLIPSLMVADGSMLAAAGLQSAEPSSGGLRIVVLVGADGVNLIDQKTAVQPAVEVRDAGGIPLAGVPVSFSVDPVGRASFANNASQVTVVTDAMGRAAIGSLRPLTKGALKIQVTATFQGQTTTAMIEQTNFASEAESRKPVPTSVGTNTLTTVPVGQPDQKSLKVPRSRGPAWPGLTVASTGLLVGILAATGPLKRRPTGQRSASNICFGSYCYYYISGSSYDNCISNNSFANANNGYREALNNGCGSLFPLKANGTIIVVGGAVALTGVLLFALRPHHSGASLSLAPIPKGFVFQGSLPF